MYISFNSHDVRPNNPPSQSPIFSLSLLPNVRRRRTYFLPSLLPNVRQCTAHSLFLHVFEFTFKVQTFRWHNPPWPPGPYFDILLFKLPGAPRTKEVQPLVFSPSRHSSVHEDQPNQYGDGSQRSADCTSIFTEVSSLSGIPHQAPLIQVYLMEWK